jgi:hypothetical protein
MMVVDLTTGRVSRNDVVIHKPTKEWLMRNRYPPPLLLEAVDVSDHRVSLSHMRQSHHATAFESKEKKQQSL